MDDLRGAVAGESDPFPLGIHNEIVRVSPGEVAQLRRIATDHGVRVEPLGTAGFEPVTTVTCILVGAAAATAAAIQALEHLRGGQIIDLRADASVPICRSKDVTFGTVIVINSDGRVSVTFREPNKTFSDSRLPAVLTAMTSRTSGDVASALTDELGSSATVSVEPSPQEPRDAG